MRKLLCCLMTAASLAMTSLVAVPSPAHADTTIEKSGTQTFRENDPCLGGRVTITVAYNAVYHENQDSAGGWHFTFTEEGDFSAVGRTDSWTGHYTVWGGANIDGPNRAQNGTFTFSAVGKSVSDGSRVRFMEVAHFTVNAKGVLTVEHEHLNADC